MTDFIPHGIILTSRAVPEPIFVAAIFGVERILSLHFAKGTPPISYPRQALEGLANRLREFKSQTLPAFGMPIGVAVNYSEDRSVTFDLEGKPLSVFNHAIQPGNAFLLLGGRALSKVEAQALLNGPVGS